MAIGWRAAAPAGRTGVGTALPLVIGDTVGFLAFAAIGRSSHSEESWTALVEVAKTAAPFLLGWFAVATPLGAYSAAPTTVLGMVRRTALCWVAAWPLGLLLRALFLWRGIPLSFAIVALLTNLVLLCGWRAGYVKLSLLRR